MVRSATWMTGGRLTWVSGVTTRCASAALAVVAVQDAVLGVLEPSEPAAVDSHEAQQLGGQELLRVDAPAGRDQLDAGDVQLLQRPGGDRGEGPAQVHEAVVAVGELLQEL